MTKYEIFFNTLFVGLKKDYDILGNESILPRVVKLGNQLTYNTKKNWHGLR